MRLIDADALSVKVEESKHKNPHGGLARLNHMNEHNHFRRMINDAPTVDAVEVVRCEKCLYRSQYANKDGLYRCGGILTENEDLILMVKPDFFCAYGERRGKCSVMI